MIFVLTTELKNFLKTSLSELYQKRPDQTWAAPQIFVGALPPKAHTGTDDPPFVIVRPVSGSDNGEDRSLVTINLVMGAHTAEGQPEAIEAGYNEVLNILNRTRQTLLANRILANRFELVPPLTWQVGGEQGYHPHPHYLSSMKTEWLIPAMQPDMLPLQKEVTGYGAT